MIENKGHLRLAQEARIPVHSDWKDGPRTSAWDRLWHAIISDVGPVAPADASEMDETEDGDV